MAAIWFKPYTLDQLNERGKRTMVEHIDIRITALTDDTLVGTMPVDERTKQPIGLLHGGASVVLAESLMSIAGNLTVDPTTHYCVGQEINANHIKSARDGLVTGTARPIHRGRTTQVWQTEIRQGDNLICVSRMTLAVLARQK